MLIGLDIRRCERSAPAPVARARKVRQRAALAPQAALPLGTARGSLDLALKRGLEMALCLVLLVPAAPVILLAALLVKLTSRGPAFYTQTRVGRDGRLFTIFKLRTMIHNCESLTGPRWAIPGDPRITRVGQILRDLHLDELPQLINVLRGDMSLIGPRPERPEFVRELERFIPDYGARLAIRPGVTGLAQLQLPPDSGLASVRAKLAQDLHYLNTRNLWLDLRILCGTACRVMGMPFRWYGPWLGLVTKPTLSPQWPEELPLAA